MKLLVAAILFMSLAIGIQPSKGAQKKINLVHVVSKKAGIDFTTERVIHLYGAIDARLLSIIAVEGLTTERIPGDRVVLIDSVGGEIEAAQRVITALKIEQELTGGKIVCIVTGQATSAAFDLLSFCDVRLATPKSTGLVHKIAYSNIPFGVRGTAKTLRTMARDLEKLDLIYDTQNAKMLHLSKKQYDVYADKQTTFTAQQLLDMGYLDDIISLDK